MSNVAVAGRPWDTFDGYLFDIDGTLMNAADAVHYFAFCEALETVSGRALTLEGVVAHGNVDVGILRDAFALGGVDEAVWRPRLGEMQAGMGRYVREHREEFRLAVLPGVVEVLDRLTARGAVLGTATGNLREIGEAKLAHVGLLGYFRVGGWSDAYETRADVFGGALALIREATRADAAICVLGDTPADVRAAKANGLPVIAVATGIYSRAQLEAELPDLCLDSLAMLLTE